MGTHRNDSGRCLAVLAVLVLTGPAHAAWIVTEVPMQPGWAGSVECTDINSSGVVSGYAENAAGNKIAFRFDGTSVTELPQLSAISPSSLPWGINAQGVVCGNSYRDDGKERAVYWVGTTLYTVPYAPDANTSSYCWATDINDSGVIVGFYWRAISETENERIAYYYKDGTTYSLDAPLRALGLTDTQIASSVNNNNVICGSAHDAGGVTTAYTYDIGTGVATLIGRIGLADCTATDINKHGQTLGRGKYYSFDTYFRAVTYDGTWQFVDDAEPASQRVGGINDRGRFVVYSGGLDTRTSWYSDAPGSDSRVYITASGWTTLNVQEINNWDWITGYGRTPTSGTDERGFIIKPPPGDGDHDGDVDLADYVEFSDCASGPGEGAGFISPSGTCLRAFDFASSDGDVDLADFAAFQRIFAGG
ncbi:MAG TPA: DUF3466 family protein [Phycisphaerae bacterium]|nr:DUF3466 family protein [Phycisphaerae bacterium]